MMLTILITAVSAAAIALQNAPTGVEPQANIGAGDPVVGDMLHDGPRQEYALVRSQARDEAWASKSEALLQRRYAELLEDHQVAGSPRVLCAASICEVAFAARPSTQNLSVLMDALQGGVLFEGLNAAGLVSGSVGFRSRTDDPTEMAHLAYWKRAQLE